jgi:hypothetical protein
MNTVSIVLIVIAGMAAAGLLYELAVERRRASLQERSRREWERLNARPQDHPHGRK